MQAHNDTDSEMESLTADEKKETEYGTLNLTSRSRPPVESPDRTVEVLARFKLEALEEYVQKNVFENTNFRLSKFEKNLRRALAVLGASWGVPWRNAAAQAAIIFSNVDARAAFETIFAGGIVITVGADGLWLMLEVGKMYGSKSIEEKRITKNTESRLVRVTEKLFPCLFAFISCIPPVYASTKYNSGAQQFLGIITFIDNYGYGLYGYSKLTRTYMEKIHKPKTEPESKELIEIRDEFINKISLIIDNSIDNPESTEELMDYLYASNGSDNELVNSLEMKNIFKWITTLIVSFSSSLVGLFLTKEFMETKILDNIEFAICMAVLAEVPGFIVTCVSTENIFGRFIDAIICKANEDSRRTIIKEIYPRASLAIPFLIFPISLTAPTAGGYITYNTFGQETNSDFLQWGATASIVAARIVFANFTLNKLVEELLLKIYEYRHETDDPINKKIRLRNLAGVISNSNLALFKPLLDERKRVPQIDEEISQAEYNLVPATPRNDDIEEVEEIPQQRSWCGIM
jgi:uncharacterized membrane protein (DUF485 family)